MGGNVGLNPCVAKACKIGSITNFSLKSLKKLYILKNIKPTTSLFTNYKTRGKKMEILL